MIPQLYERVFTGQGESALTVKRRRLRGSPPARSSRVMCVVISLQGPRRPGMLEIACLPPELIMWDRGSREKRGARLPMDASTGDAGEPASGMSLPKQPRGA